MFFLHTQSFRKLIIFRKIRILIAYLIKRQLQLGYKSSLLTRGDDFYAYQQT